MEHKKLFFETSVVWTENTTGLVVAPSADEPIEAATPMEFPDGEEGKWSPETLFLGAIGSCFMTTFLSFAKRSDLSFIKFRCHAEGDVEMLNGRLQFSVINLYPEVHLVDEDQKLLCEQLLERTEKYCLISNSLKARIIMHSTVTAEEKVLVE